MGGDRRATHAGGVRRGEFIDHGRGDLHDIREHPGIFLTLTARTGRVTSLREIPLTVIEAPGDFVHSDATPLPRY